MTGACLFLMVERGLVGLDQPVTQVWPELGDERLLVRHVLTHTAGRISVPAGVDLTDWEASVAALAAAEPGWPPGEKMCEHAKTFGHLMGKIVRRVDGRTVGRVLDEEFARPLGLDVHIDVRPQDEDRVAR